MKKLVMLTLGMIFAGSILAQQDRPNLSSEEKANEAAIRMKKNLELTKDQEKKVFEVYKKFFDDVKMMREKADKNRELMKEINRTRDEELKSVLSEEQYKKFEKAMQDRPRAKNRDEKREKRGQVREN